MARGGPPLTKRLEIVPIRGHAVPGRGQPIELILRPPIFDRTSPRLRGRAAYGGGIAGDTGLRVDGCDGRQSLVISASGLKADAIVDVGRNVANVLKLVPGPRSLFCVFCQR